MQQFEDKAHDVEQSSLNRTLADKYVFFMNMPDCLKNSSAQYVAENKNSGIDRDRVTLSLISATVPNMVMRAEEMKYGGASMHISSHTKDAYEPLVIKFNIDNEFNNYFTLYEWWNFIQDEKYGRFDAHNLTKSNSYKAYSNNLGVAAMDEFNNIKIMWTYTNAFITKLGGFTLDYQQHGEIPCEATFSYSQCYVRSFRREGLQRGVDSNLLV